jgi:hypothetical protein
MMYVQSGIAQLNLQTEEIDEELPPRIVLRKNLPNETRWFVASLLRKLTQLSLSNVPMPYGGW